MLADFLDFLGIWLTACGQMFCFTEHSLPSTKHRDVVNTVLQLTHNGSIWMMLKDFLDSWEYGLQLTAKYSVSLNNLSHPLNSMIW